jgi:hypothetical protein
MYPATIGQTLTKHLMCQLVRCGLPARIRKSTVSTAFRVRQRRAGHAFGAAVNARHTAEIRLIARQFGALSVIPINAAPFAGNIDPQTGRVPQPWQWLKR